MSTASTTLLALDQISIDSPELEVGNRLTPHQVSNQTTMTHMGFDYYDHKRRLGVKMLDTQEMIQLLCETDYHIAVPCDADRSDHRYPSVGQRMPTKDRRKKIRNGWSNPSVVPNGKIETVQLSHFGGRVTSDGLRLEQGVSIIWDGAGRLASLLDEMNDLNNEKVSIIVPEQRNILWQLNFDLSGCLLTALQGFLLQNQYLKRTSPGTNVGVSIAMLNVMDKTGNPLDISERKDLNRAAIVRELYQRNLSGTVLELYPWNYEGNSALKNGHFKGIGVASSLVTALKECEEYIAPLNISQEEMPDALEFVFRKFYENSPRAVRDAHLVGKWDEEEGQNHKSKFHLHTSLALKVMVMLGLRAYALGKMDFVENVEEILNTHYDHHGIRGDNSQYVNPHTKKMSIDKFWCEHIRFVKFTNSGKVETQILIKTLNRACIDVERTR